MEKRRDLSNTATLLAVVVAVVAIIFILSTSIGAVDSPVQIFADSENNTTTAATPTTTPTAEGQEGNYPTPVGTSSVNPGGGSGGNSSEPTPEEIEITTDSPQSNTEGDDTPATTASDLVNTTALRTQMRERVLNYRLENEIDEYEFRQPMTDGRTNEELERLAQNHSRQLAANESIWGTNSWDRYNWEQMYERHGLESRCSISATSADGISYAETYERGHLMAVSQVNASGLNRTEIVNATMNDWEGSAPRIAKLEYQSASYLNVGVTASSETTNVYITVAFC